MLRSENSIIDAQTYYTAPINDWVFNENLKMTYNNPEFHKQLKHQNKDINELNTGWADQYKVLGEEEEEEELDVSSLRDKYDKYHKYDDDYNDDDDYTVDDEYDDNKYNDEDEDDYKSDITFKFNKNKANSNIKEETKYKSSIEINKPTDTLEDLNNMFKKHKEVTDSTRSKVENAINNISHEKQNIKLNLTKPAMSNNIKLNINKRDS